MFRRITFGLLASGGVLFLAGAIGLTASWSLVSGALLLATASVPLAVALEDGRVAGPTARTWPPDGGTPAVERPPLGRAA